MSSISIAAFDWQNRRYFFIKCLYSVCSLQPFWFSFLGLPKWLWMLKQNHQGYFLASTSMWWTMIKKNHFKCGDQWSKERVWIRSFEKNWRWTSELETFKMWVVMYHSFPTIVEINYLIIIDLLNKNWRSLLFCVFFDRNAFLNTQANNLMI